MGDRNSGAGVNEDMIYRCLRDRCVRVISIGAGFLVFLAASDYSRVCECVSRRESASA